MHRIIYAALAAFSLSASPALAQGFHDMDGDLPRLHHMLKIANLTADQKNRKSMRPHEGVVPAEPRAAPVAADPPRADHRQAGAVRLGERLRHQLTACSRPSPSGRSSTRSGWLHALQIRGILTPAQIDHVAQAVYVQMKNLKAQMKSVAGTSTTRGPA